MIAQPEKDLEDKVVLVTGASRWLNRRIDIEFAKIGLKVIVNYNQNHSEAERTLAEVKCILIIASLSISKTL